MGYQEPNAWVSASWSNHKNRNPPSSEPGTDYALAYGMPLYAPSDGKVIEIKTSNSGGMGRYVAFAFNDGRTFRHIHMSKVEISVGTQVSKGQYVGLSGASGNGSDWYYGPHVHSTLWPHGYWDNPTIDFQLHVGEDTEPIPIPPIVEDEDNMSKMKGAYYTRKSDGETLYLLFNEDSGWWSEYSGVDAAYNNNIAKNWETGSYTPISESHAAALKRDLDLVKPK